eukprot:g1216.t1
MGDATNETFEVTLQRQGPYPAQRHGFSCQATHEAVLARAIQLHEEHLAQREARGRMQPWGTTWCFEKGSE